jgi:hypothetical protein
LPPLRKTWRPGAPGIRDDGLLKLGQMPEHVEAALNGRDELLGLDAIGGAKQAMAELEHDERAQEGAVEGHGREAMQVVEVDLVRRGHRWS